MAAFHGINDTADNGIVKTSSATKVYVPIMGSANPAISGVSFFIDYTKGTETSITLTATMIAQKVAHATNEYQLDSSSTSTPATFYKTYTGSGKWIWAIPVPALTPADLVLTMTTSGSADSTTVVTIDAARDTVHGS